MPVPVSNALTCAPDYRSIRRIRHRSIDSAAKRLRICSQSHNTQ